MRVSFFFLPPQPYFQDNNHNSRRRTPMHIINIRVQLLTMQTRRASAGCHLQSHLPPRETAHALCDTGRAHFVIGNVTREHLPRCHYLITVCRNDTVVSAILNTEKQERGAFSRQICTLSDNVAQVRRNCSVKNNVV